MRFVNLCHVGLKARKFKTWYRVFNQADEYIQDFETLEEAKKFVVENNVKLEGVIL